MNKCYLSIGSNQKNPMRQLKHAIKALKEMPASAVTQISSLHWTMPWGLKKQQIFCNAVVEIQTRLSPLVLLKTCNLIESKLGRVRRKRWGPRALDIDIILYADRVMKTRKLSIPHKHWLSRDFVVIPLSELNPNLIKKNNL